MKLERFMLVAAGSAGLSVSILALTYRPEGVSLVLSLLGGLLALLAVLYGWHIGRNVRRGSLR